ncbi:hypothetical protein Vadar_010615 [Vaccinium darrowii]|uniref:Uncharacterized protein n=1 Tax=Vaccinium darrowii TaxID=229202 RepID=A0ACB7Y5X3_9ERIC|nr:hypothetical protein Vadar_010615 [Vaccinium darrowii]
MCMDMIIVGQMMRISYVMGLESFDSFTYELTCSDTTTDERPLTHPTHQWRTPNPPLPPSTHDHHLFSLIEGLNDLMESKGGEKKPGSSKSLFYEAPLGYSIEDVRPAGGIKKFRSVAFSSVLYLVPQFCLLCLNLWFNNFHHVKWSPTKIYSSSKKEKELNKFVMDQNTITFIISSSNKELDQGQQQ